MLMLRPLQISRRPCLYHFSHTVDRNTSSDTQQKASILDASTAYRQRTPRKNRSDAVSSTYATCLRITNQAFHNSTFHTVSPEGLKCETSMEACAYSVAGCCGRAGSIPSILQPPASHLPKSKVPKVPKSPRQCFSPFDKATEVICLVLTPATIGAMTFNLGCWRLLDYGGLGCCGSFR